MQIMNNTDEQKIMRSLLSVVDQTRSGADPEAAMVKVASMRGYTPPIIERMCESYNKAKSVHMLQKTSMDNRADSFPLINARNVIDQIFKSVEKEAGTYKIIPNMLKIDFHTKTLEAMEKTAAEHMAGPMEKTASDDTDEPNFDLVYDRLSKKQIREQASLEKEASEIRQERIRIERTVDDLSGHLRSYSNKKLNKVAQKVYNKYNAKGDQLLAVVYAKLNKEKPNFEKTAKTVIFPLAEPFVSITRAMEGYKHYADLTKAQKKIEKTATVAQLLAAAGMPSLNEVAMASVKRDKLDDKGGSTLLGAKLKNRIKRLDSVDTFYDMYTSDDYLRDQPVDQVIKAYNTVTSMMPSLTKDDAKKVYIGPLVRKLVSEGNRVDPLEISRMASMESELLKADKTKQEAAKTEAEISAGDRPEAAPIGEELLNAGIASDQKRKDRQSGIMSKLKASATGLGSALKESAALGISSNFPADVNYRSAESQFNRLGKNDVQRLIRDGIVDADGNYPTDHTKRQAVADYISGKTPSTIAEEPKKKSKGPEAQKPGAPGPEPEPEQPGAPGPEPEPEQPGATAPETDPEPEPAPKPEPEQPPPNTSEQAAQMIASLKSAQNKNNKGTRKPKPSQNKEMNSFDDLNMEDYS